MTANSVLEAILSGDWNYEPTDVESTSYEPTAAMPGTDAKLEILAKRIERGLPLWHPEDRITFNDKETE